MAGHRLARARISSAIRSGTLPQVLLISGAPGIGKERFGLWLGQLLLCTNPEGGEPCGKCGACLRVLNLAHPDLHWIVPIPRPKATEAEKQVVEAGESIENILAERRKEPFWLSPDGMSSHGIASARLIQRRASISSAEGGARVFLIGHAERLVPQEASQEAANAILKLLEEPPVKSWFILTTTTPGQVLSTIRSRSAPLRLGRLTDGEVAEFLRAERPEFATDELIAAAHGAIGSIIHPDTEAGRAHSAAQEWLTAVSGGSETATESALKQGPWQARGDFTLLLDALIEQLSEQARIALTNNQPALAGRVMAGINLVHEARERAQGNINPQLLLAVLADGFTAAGVT